MSVIPPKLAELLEEFAAISDRYERYEILTEYADEFKEVPRQIATPPYPKEHQVPHCESQAYVWIHENDNHTLTFYFAVENPQGLSAKAMATIVDHTCSGEPAWMVANIPDDLPQRLFGRDLSMGRTLGLTSLVAMVRHAARRHVAQCPECQAALEEQEQQGV